MEAKSKLKKLKDQILELEKDFGRTPHSVNLLIVSKGRQLEQLLPFIEAGHRDFGESYVQEALPKINHFFNYSLHWHFIGVIQANKTAAIAENFAWVHSVDRLLIAERLNRQRSTELPPLNICLEVNVSEDPHKSGLTIQALPELAKAVVKLPHLRLRGLMTIIKQTSDEKEQRYYFSKLRQAQEELIAQGFTLDTLSMGMSQDFIAAIAEGATIVRIGTALFEI